MSIESDEITIHELDDDTICFILLLSKMKYRTPNAEVVFVMWNEVDVATLESIE